MVLLRAVQRQLSNVLAFLADARQHGVWPHHGVNPRASFRGALTSSYRAQVGSPPPFQLAPTSALLNKMSGWWSRMRG